MNYITTWPQTLTVNDPVMYFSLQSVDKKIKVMKYSYVWYIHSRARCVLKSHEIMQSPTFSIGSLNEFEACLNIYPDKFVDKCLESGSESGSDSDSDTEVSKGLYLSIPYQQHQICLDLSATAKFFLLRDTAQGELKQLINDEIALVPETFRAGFGWGHKKCRVPDVLWPSQTEFMLSKSVLKICCEILFLTDDSSVTFEMPQKALLEGIASLCIDTRLADVTFDISGEKLKAHKAILSARSEVFKAMFENDMAEANTNRVCITDASVGVFKDFLLFVYTGKVNGLAKLGQELLGMADKYDMPDLRAVCEESLGKHLNVDNAAETFLTAHRYRSKLLKEKAKQFILRHLQQVKETQGWSLLKEEQSLLVSTLFGE